MTERGEDIFRCTMFSIILSCIIIIAFSVAFMATVWAHEWYPLSCCSDKDCHPIDSCSELTESADGGIDWGKYHFSKERVKPSQDAKCHVCIYSHATTWSAGPDGKPYENPMCVFIQQGS